MVGHTSTVVHCLTAGLSSMLEPTFSYVPAPQDRQKQFFTLTYFPHVFTGLPPDSLVSPHSHKNMLN